MKSPISATRRTLLAGLFGIGAALASPLAASVVFAHEAPCPYCGMTVTQDTATQDNEVALKSGRKRIEYKCVYCALADVGEYKGDLTISAPSEKKGEPVVLKREGEKWTALPEAPYFVSAAKLKHKVCQEQARAFTTQEAAQKYIEANKQAVGDAKALTLSEMLQVAGVAGSTTAPADPHAEHANHPAAH